jgi:hypothetical protein
MGVEVLTDGVRGGRIIEGGDRLGVELDLDALE